MAITALPTPPSRSDPLNFADRADAFLGQLPQFATEANALALEVNGYATTASTAASNASSSASAAAASALTAANAANYKGEWSTLTGALAIPASVSYDGRLYVLKQNIADVTANTPGVSSVWLIVGEYKEPISVSTNTNVLVFKLYKVTANCNLTLPASPANGEWIDFVNNLSTGSFTIVRNGKTIGGVADNLNHNVKNKTIRLMYQSANNDWIIIL